MKKLMSYKILPAAECRSVAVVLRPLLLDRLRLPLLGPETILGCNNDEHQLLFKFSYHFF